MKYLFMIKNVTNLIRRHPILVCIMIVQVAIVLSLAGLMTEDGKRLETNAEAYAETYGNKYYYTVNEGTTDLFYYTYLEKENEEGFHTLNRMKQAFYEESSFRYISIAHQPVDLWGKEMNHKFLYGYESGEYESSISEEEDTTRYFIKSLQVSEDFFDEFDIKVEKGNGFKESDYVYKRGKPIPVILGSDYEGSLQIGDTLEGEYLFEKTEFKVVGMLSKQSFYYDTLSESLESTARYMIIPVQESEQATEHAKIMNLQQIAGVIISEQEYLKVKEQVDKLIEEEKAEDFGVYIKEPEDGAASILDDYSSMTKEVEKQFMVILGITLLFVCLSTIYTLYGFMKEERERYGIEMLCGASVWDIVSDIMLLDIIIMTAGVMVSLAVMGVCQCSMKNVIWVILIAIGIILAETIYMMYQLLHFEVKDLIGGAE